MHLHLVMVVAALVSGCATRERPDSMKAMNRRVFAFNEAIDRSVVAPVARSYVKAVPSPLRTGIGNVFKNLQDIGSALNLFLQGRVRDGLSDIARVGSNTTVGVLGIFDVAAAFGLPRHAEDFGQTLGRWGVDSGAYVVWPILGPSTVRNSAAMPVDLVTSPRLGLGAMPPRLTHTRATLLPATSMLENIALDRYLFLRDTFLQHRLNLVHDGTPPDE